MKCNVSIAAPNSYVYVYRNNTRGIVTCRLKRSEQKRMASAIKEARVEISRIPGAQALWSSFSCTMGLRSVDYCVEQLRIWMNWHQHWVYREVVDDSIVFPPNCPLRQHVNALRNIVEENDAASNSSWEAGLGSEHSDDDLNCAVEIGSSDGDEIISGEE